MHKHNWEIQSFACCLVTGWPKLIAKILGCYPCGFAGTTQNITHPILRPWVIPPGSYLHTSSRNLLSCCIINRSSMREEPATLRQHSKSFIWWPLQSSPAFLMHPYTADGRVQAEQTATCLKPACKFVVEVPFEPGTSHRLH